ncbi:hypothetical protein GQ42DRAFT_112418, partial [Ramicandelaber brevisporus]
YRLEVVQQPLRARMCGFGDRDRRPITPQPIVKLHVYDRDHNSVDPLEIDTTLMICQAQLLGTDGIAPLQVVQQPNISPDALPPASMAISNQLGIRFDYAAHARNLIGSTVTMAVKARDTDDNWGIFFVFQDISVRAEGEYTLHFTVIHGMHMMSRSPTPVIARITSNVFTVFSAKKFPGMIESTSLAQRLANQGARIPIR